VTLFNELYPTVRVFLGDLNAAAPGYSNSQLDMGIAAALLRDDTFSEGTQAPSGGGRTITPTVSAKDDLLRLSIRSAICLLSPNRGPFSYRTRVFSVSRNLREHMVYLEDLEQQVVEGEVTIGSETEWDQFVRGVDNVLDKLSEFPNGT